MSPAKAFDAQSIRDISSIPATPEGREAVLAHVVAAVTEMIRDWDRAFADPVGAHTLLMAELGFQSIDVVVLTGELSQRLNRRDIPYERLLVIDGRPVADLRLGTLVDFLWDQFRTTP
jgi:acyl carrier protein